MSAELIEHWKKDCNRHTNGFCSTRRCLVRGGYCGTGPVDYSIATCEEHETVLALASRDPEAAKLEIDTPYRSMDEAGSPESAGTVGWNWISEIADRERKRDGADLLRIDDAPSQGSVKVTRLYRGTTLLAVTTTFRDDMNFTVLVRWLSPDMRDAAEAAKLEEMRAEIAELRKRCEVVNIRVDGKPFKVMRETMGFRIYSLVRSSNDYHLAREILGGSQAEDIPDLFDPLIVNEGDSFVTFPGARFG